MNTRHVFFVSDGTGITAETLGNTLLTQFEGVNFSKSSLPFVTTVEKARVTVDYINHLAASDAARPLVFSTTVNDAVRAVLRECKAHFVDLFDTYIHALEAELGVGSTHAQGQAHSAKSSRYDARIEAVNFALEHDDGQSLRDLMRADLILVAPSRCGKTPTSLYLALQYGVFATNFPLLEEDLEKPALPRALAGMESKLFGITSDAERLSQVRNERKPGSCYASLAQCSYELRQAEILFRRLNIPHLNSAAMSIEEMAATILQEKGLRGQGLRA
jgi:[pyruvate, water dikinase]-phosphate phosphotransferase / [pyruvate, water dikinase] kinase